MTGPVRARVALAVAACLALACGGSGHGRGGEHERPLAFLHGNGEAGAETAALPPPAGALEIESLPVELEGETFRVATRAGEWVPRLVQAPCGQCHAPEGMTLPAAGSAAVAQVHARIGRSHGAAGLGCAACHAPGDPGRLHATGSAAGPEGGTVDLLHAYRHCRTCHFEQVRDWAGGAHGKRLGGWSGPRVVAPCSSCHDPHEPAIPQRTPATFSPPLEEPEP